MVLHKSHSNHEKVTKILKRRENIRKQYNSKCYTSPVIIGFVNINESRRYHECVRRVYAGHSKTNEK